MTTFSFFITWQHFITKKHFLKQKTELQIILEWRKENVERNTDKETETREDELKQVKGPNSEQGGNSFHWKRNSVLVMHSANEVF